MHYVMHDVMHYGMHRAMPHVMQAWLASDRDMILSSVDATVGSTELNHHEIHYVMHCVMRYGMQRSQDLPDEWGFSATM